MAVWHRRPCRRRSPRPRHSHGHGHSSDEATSRRRYRCWELSDEIKVLDTIARLREDNMGDHVPASVLLQALQGGHSPIRRSDLDAACLSQKVYHLKKKFIKAAKKAAANGGKRPRKKRGRALYEHSMLAWPELLPPAAAAGHKARAINRIRTPCGGARVLCF